MKTVDSKQQAPRFGANPKKITCRCNAEEMEGDVITIQMNSRCPVCDSLYCISMPKPATAQTVQQPKRQVSVLSIDRSEEQMKPKQEAKVQTPRFGANPKKIMCQCNQEESQENVITIRMNSRCPVCNSLYYISVPKPSVEAVQQPKRQTSVVSIERYMERRMQMARELNAHLVYRASDWVTGVLAL